MPQDEYLATLTTSLEKANFVSFALDAAFNCEKREYMEMGLIIDTLYYFERNDLNAFCGEVYTCLISMWANRKKPEAVKYIHDVLKEHDYRKNVREAVRFFIYLYDVSVRPTTEDAEIIKLFPLAESYLNRS